MIGRPDRTQRALVLVRKAKVERLSNFIENTRQLGMQKAERSLSGLVGRRAGFLLERVHFL